MYTTLVHVHVIPEHTQAFIEACRLNHEASTQESGNRRFDILQSSDDLSFFILYEAYASEADAAAHKETEHYKTWRSTVADWMAQPRKGVKFDGLYPN